MNVQFMQFKDIKTVDDENEYPAAFMSPLFIPKDEFIGVIDEEIERLSLKSKYPKYAFKMRTLFASLITAAPKDVEESIVAIPMKNGWWSQFGNLGSAEARKFKVRLEQEGILEEIQQALVGPYGLKGQCALYLVDQEWLERFKDVKTATSRYPNLVRIKNKAKNELFDLEKSKDIQNDLIHMLDYWEKHPLLYKDNSMTVARRVFNKNLERGGRYYGPWTSMPKTQRMKTTIDGEAVCQVDISAAFLTMLQAITKITSFAVGEEITDPYSPKRLHNILGGNGITRDKIKIFINSWIGGGNPKRNKAGGLKEFEDNKSFIEFRNAILPYFPELRKVNKINLEGMVFQKHESNVITSVIHSLRKMEVVAYPMHDCLIVKEKDVDQAVFALQKSMRFYLRDIGALEIEPALTVEMADGSTKKVSGKRFS